MNYKNIYGEIMLRAKDRPKPDCYVERHHIEPRSVGGTNGPENLVYLTAKEHFLAHKLWVRYETDAFRKRKDQNAVWSMVTMRSKSTAGRIIPSIREYEQAKIMMRASKLGVPRSEETKLKLSMSLTRHFANNGSHNKGRSYNHLSNEERIELFGSKNRGRIQSEEEKERRAAKLRKPRTEQAKENIKLGALKREAARRASKLING